jgi:hypothetical protein
MEPLNNTKDNEGDDGSQISQETLQLIETIERESSTSTSNLTNTNTNTDNEKIDNSSTLRKSTTQTAVCCYDSEDLNSSDEENNTPNQKKNREDKVNDPRNSNINNEKQKTNTKYHLVAVVHHLGQLATCGHYISDIREYFKFIQSNDHKSHPNKENNNHIQIQKTNHKKNDWKSYDDVKVSDVCFTLVILSHC